MSKILFIGDTHYRYTNPSLRIDCYREDIENCINESLNIAANKQCEAVIFLGDIFDSFEPNGIVRNEIIKIFQTSPSGESWGIPMYSVIGNHDIIGHNPDSLMRTALGTLSQCGLEIPHKKLKLKDTSIYFGHYQHDIEHIDHSNNDCEIYVMHANILPTPFISDDHILIKDFKVHQKTELVISGHYHPGYPSVHRDDGVIFCNPGAIARKSATKSDIERKLQVLFVDIDQDNLKIANIPLKTAGIGKQIFNLQAALDNKNKRLSRNELAKKLDGLRSSGIFKLSDSIIDDFKIFCKDHKNKDEIIKLISSIIDEIKNERKIDE